MEENAVIVDARNLLCPMPVIRVQNVIEDLPAGTMIKAVCTDPGVLHDIPAWVRVHGHELISTSEEDGEYIVTVKVRDV